MAQGILTFPSVAAALRDGYVLYDRSSDGILVRTKTAGGWAMALVPSCHAGQS